MMVVGRRFIGGAHAIESARGRPTLPPFLPAASAFHISSNPFCPYPARGAAPPAPRDIFTRKFVLLVIRGTAGDGDERQGNAAN
jgi:hypothetical protein